MLKLLHTAPRLCIIKSKPEEGKRRSHKNKLLKNMLQSTFH